MRVRSGLTVVGHANHEALLEAAVLALVARLFVDATPEITVVVNQLQPNRSSEKTLWKVKGKYS